MRQSLCVVACTLIALVSLQAAEAKEAEVNSLTPAQIAEGWILLFDGRTPFGWKTEGEAKVEEGSLVLGEAKAAQAETTTEFGDFELKFEYQVSGAGPVGLVLNGTSHDMVSTAGDKGWMRGSCLIESSGDSHRIGLQFSPAEDEKHAGDRRSTKQSGLNRTTVGFKVPEGVKLSLRNVYLKPLGMKAIFNGKDLTGWKEVPGRRSKFTVMPKGELNVKDGNGDLHTVDQWDDFVLQIDIISNGEHLNSGIFFRCLPGEYWSGYESQIRNQWQGDDRTKPVDYGTGGIYNRQPARKVVSSDHEWFTKTLIVHGPHMAVWVNGYQVSDFTDTRPPAKSGRNGLKVDKGTISIQGHDPTTDLSFRNIRVAAIPKK